MFRLVRCHVTHLPLFVDLWATREKVSGQAYDFRRSLLFHSSACVLP